MVAMNSNPMLGGAPVFTELEVKEMLRSAWDQPEPRCMAVDWALLPWNADAAKVAGIAERKIREDKRSGWWR